jgi:glycosyltransferase involved in cell wall biosynthesis
VKVAYIVSRFPKLTETFILYEMVALHRQGVEIELFPLFRARTGRIKGEGGSVWRKAVELLQPGVPPKMHPEAVAITEQAHFTPMVSVSVVVANVHWLLRRPLAYVKTLGILIVSNWGSMNLLVGGLLLFPKMAYIADRIGRLGATHVHAHFANHPAAAAFVVGRLTGLPYSFTAHGADFQVDQHMLCRKVREAQFVVTVADANRRAITDHCHHTHDKIHVISSGVDTTHFSPPVGLERGNLASDMFTIVAIGTFYEVKGQTYLIDACRQLSDEGLAYRCLLVGEGPHEATLRAQVEAAGITERIEFTGPKDHGEVASLLQEADVLVLPSIPTQSGRREGLPVVLQEAMASGLPVVASGISGIPELVEHERNGILVPPADPQQLASALGRLAADVDLRKRLGAEARRTVLERFDLHANARQLAALFSGTES